MDNIRNNVTVQETALAALHVERRTGQKALELERYLIFAFSVHVFVGEKHIPHFRMCVESIHVT